MAIYKVIIEKTFNGVPFAGEKWTNVYNVQELTVDDAVTTGEAIAAMEMAVSYTPIVVTSVKAFDPGNTNDKAISHPNITAALDPTGLGGTLPLFNTVRVVLGDNQGAAEQKYLRLGANADNIGSGTWDGAFITAVQDDYCTPLQGVVELCGPSGEDISTATALAAVQMRQLGWSRRTRPGFHRGYVPN